MHSSRVTYTHGTHVQGVGDVGRTFEVLSGVGAHHRCGVEDLRGRDHSRVAGAGHVHRGRCLSQAKRKRPAGRRCPALFIHPTPLPTLTLSSPPLPPLAYRCFLDGRGRRHGGLGGAAVREAQVAQGRREERGRVGGLCVRFVLGVDGHDSVVPPLRDAVGTLLTVPLLLLLFVGVICWCYWTVFSSGMETNIESNDSLFDRAASRGIVQRSRSERSPQEQGVRAWRTYLWPRCEI